MKKNAKKKALATLVALVLVIACAVGATFAWFTDSSESIDNTFVVGNVDIVLYESNSGSVSAVTDQATADTQNADYKAWLETEDTGAGYNILPGSVIAKDTVVKNVGANAAWVRIDVTVPKAIADVVTLTAVTDENTELKTTTNDNGDTVYSYYKKAYLAVGNEFVVENDVKVATTAVEADFEDLTDNIFKITVQAHAIQAQGLTYAEAWEAYKAPGTYDVADEKGYVDEPTDPQL